MLALKSIWSGGRNGTTAAADGPARAQGIATRMAGSAGPAYACATVTHGRHAGAAVDLKKPLVSIGSALSNSVVLIDADVLPRHALISFVSDSPQHDGSAANGLAAKLTARANKTAATATIEAVDGNVLAGIQLIEAGQVIDVQLPCTLKFGSCTIELTRPKPQPSASMVSRPTAATAGNRGRWILPTVATLAGVTGLSVLGLYKTVTGDWGPSKLTVPRFDGIKTDAGRPAVAAPNVPNVPTSAPRASLQPPGPIVSAPAAPAASRLAPEWRATSDVPVRPTAAATPTTMAPKPAEPVIGSAPAALANDDRQIVDLRQRLLTAGLDKTLSVERRGNMLVVDGIVSSATYGRWREVKDALSGIPNALGSSVITDLVKTSTSANVPNNSIASVVLGKTPYVMSTNGRRARVGEVLEDGWLVEAITADTVTMRRGQAVNRINPADGFSK
jgi:Inner membrane component of T3SS, periplasmic domain